MVRGTFECGTEAQPFNGSLVMTLTGMPTTEASERLANSTGGLKALSVLGNGKLLLHGKKAAWVNLATTAPRGSTTITVCFCFFFLF